MCALFVTKLRCDFKNASYAPALQLGEWTSFHDLNLVTKTTFILLIMSVNNGLTLNLFTIKRVWDLVEVSDLDGFVTRTAGYFTNEGFTRIPSSLCNVDTGLGVMRLR